MEMPDLDQFDMERFLEDHRDCMRVERDRVLCRITDDRAMPILAFGGKTYNTPINDLPRCLVDSIQVRILELKHAVKQLAYLAPYCQKKEEAESE